MARSCVTWHKSVKENSYRRRNQKLCSLSSDVQTLNDPTILYLYQSSCFDFDPNQLVVDSGLKNENRISFALGHWRRSRPPWALGSAIVSRAAGAARRRSHHPQRQSLDGRKDHPTAQAVAVLGDRIVAVGSNAEVEAWHGAHTRVIDAAGKLIAPRLQRLPRAFCRWRRISRQRAVE